MQEDVQKVRFKAIISNKIANLHAWPLVGVYRLSILVN